MVLQDYFDDGSGKGPRYYQATAVNTAIEAIAKGQDPVPCRPQRAGRSNHGERLPPVWRGHGEAEHRYQAITGPEDRKKPFRELSPDFFDLIVVDECHRGSAAEDSAWREILEYFSSATQIGMTATPKETKYVSNIDYFGKPIYSYSLKQGISDGFLAPLRGRPPTFSTATASGSATGISDREARAPDPEAVLQEALATSPGSLVEITSSPRC
jgi:type I restriction enzyme R subunit